MCLTSLEHDGRSADHFTVLTLRNIAIHEKIVIQPSIIDQGPFKLLLTLKVEISWYSYANFRKNTGFWRALCQHRCTIHGPKDFMGDGNLKVPCKRSKNDFGA